MSATAASRARIACLAGFACLATLPVGFAPAPALAAAETASAARFDELWSKRDDPAALAELKQLVDRGLVQAPADYGLLWRAAAWHFWTSDDPARSKDERKTLGKAGWDLAERAVAANPQGAEGHFFAAGTMGNYSLAIGILRALTQRIEGKFIAHLSEAERLAPQIAHGAIPVAWGRYHAQLPWPKYDKKKATAQYQRALVLNPANLRARVYFAELLLDERDPGQAKRLLDEVAAAPVGRYDAPEERRCKLLGAALMPKVVAALK